MSRTLRLVPPSEPPSEFVPTSMLEAVHGPRRDLLELARDRIAQEIDEGVPAHTLGRLISDLAKLDTEIRALAERDDAEKPAEVRDSPFDYGAI